jgi:hypothetical protein
VVVEEVVEDIKLPVVLVVLVVVQMVVEDLLGVLVVMELLTLVVEDRVDLPAEVQTPLEVLAVLVSSLLLIQLDNINTQKTVDNG